MPSLVRCSIALCPRPPVCYRLPLFRGTIACHCWHAHIESFRNLAHGAPTTIVFRTHQFAIILALLSAGISLVTGCAAWQLNAPPRADVPDRQTVALDQLVIHSNFDLPVQHRLLQDLNAERTDVSSHLNLPLSDEKIDVYIFREPEQFYEFIRRKYPNFPDRRAFFIETDTRLAVYAYWGDRAAEDLRHEVCHGYLHSMVENLPLWLDEGLAKYFEVPRGTRGLNSPMLAELVKHAQDGTWHPDIRRLENFRSPADMTEVDYAESWAWVYWLLETTPERKALLQEYLADLHRTGQPTPLSIYIRRLSGDPEHDLFEYIRQLQSKQ